MNKKQRIKWIHKAINQSGKPYKILDEGPIGPRHIRVEGVGDIWPSTGTYSVKGNFKKGSPRTFLTMLGEIVDEPKKESKYEQLEKRVVGIEEYCAHLEDEISKLKQGIIE